jgi:hypothetical protein
MTLVHRRGFAAGLLGPCRADWRALARLATRRGVLQVVNPHWATREKFSWRRDPAPRPVSENPTPSDSVLGGPIGIGISKIHVTATAQVTGKWKNMGHGTGVGPAKDISRINGSALRHKFEIA